MNKTTTNSLEMTAGKDVLLAQEKGMDVYTKVPDIKCHRSKMVGSK